MLVKCIKQQMLGILLVDIVMPKASPTDSEYLEAYKHRTETRIAPFEIGLLYPTYAILINRVGNVDYVLSGNPFEEGFPTGWLTLVSHHEFEVADGGLDEGWVWQDLNDQGGYRAGIAPGSWGNILHFLGALQAGDEISKRKFLTMRRANMRSSHFEDSSK